MEETKKRSRKTSSEQMEIILQVLSSNKILLTGKCHPNATQEVETKWDELTHTLNNVPGGARKDKKQWKCFFSEWKSKTKKKARISKQSLIKTGGGGYTSKHLSDLEIRLMSLIGWITVLGCEDVPMELDPTDSMPPSGEYEVRDDGVAYPVFDSEIELPEVTEAETEASVNCITGTTPKAPKFGVKKKTVTQKPQTHLEKSAEMYAESVIIIARSVDNMAKSISELAEAITAIAHAIGQTNVHKV